MPQSASDIWVGTFPKTGALVVYDPLLQVAGQAEISVYSVTRDGIRKFEPSHIRAIAQTVHGATREEALGKYLAWRLLNGSAYVEKERRRIEAEQIQAELESAQARADAKRATDSLIERHKAHLNAVGREYRGAAFRASNVREAHCWRCRASLSSHLDLACLSCNWMLCACGACGCGRVT